MPSLLFGRFLSYALVLTCALSVNVAAQSNYATPYDISTLAGVLGGPGDADGTGSSAGFNFPEGGVAVDAAGNLYVADSDNHTIRKVTPAGAVTTFAGTAGIFGSSNGTGGAAQFANPRGVAVDATGNVFVADTDNHTIRKITSAGVVTTFAGSAGVSGATNGAGSAARFKSPRGIVADATGNLYVADTGNQSIRKITPVGTVTTLAGTAGVFGSVDSVGSAASFFAPYGIAVDGAGNCYVVDNTDSKIRKIDAAGVVTTLAGTSLSRGSTDGTGSGARFTYPYGIAVDATGTVYVADTGNSTIRKITPAGVVTTFAGSVGVAGSIDGTGTAAQFTGPVGIAVDASGVAYVVDGGNNKTIRKISAAGVVTTFAGSVGLSGSADGTGTGARFDTPYGVAVDSAGTVYVADTTNHTIRKIVPTGVVTTIAGSPGLRGSTDGTGSAARFYLPRGIAVDDSGNLYVADVGNYTVRKITAAGVVTTLAGYPGAPGSSDGTGSFAKFYGLRGIAVDTSGNVYVADGGFSVIKKITPAGVVTTLAGLIGNSGSADGTGTAARFDSPYGLAVDATGTIYVTDANNYTIRKITSAAVVTTIAGSVGNSGSADGIGSAARFAYAQGVAVDPGGNIFIADANNHTIRKITPDGAVTTLAGLTGHFGSSDGIGSAARFDAPSAIAVDSAGVLYVTSRSCIRKGQLAGAQVISTQPLSQTVAAGTSAQFSVIAAGVPAYQWQRRPAGAGIWENLSEGGYYSNTTTASLTVSGVTGAMNGDQFRCIATNLVNSATSNAATLTVIVAPSGAIISITVE